MNKKRIAIILELKNRELPYFVLLKEMLEQQGHKVKLISFRSACSVQLLLFRPQIVLVNGLRSYDSYIKQMYIPKRLFGAVVVCLYSEQIVYSENGRIAETYNNPKIWKAVDYHITWGKTFANALAQIGIEKDKIWVLGCLQNDLKYYLSHSLEEQKQQFADLYGLDAQKEWSIFADNVVPGTLGADYNTNRDWMNSLVLKVSKMSPDVEFILRLHPEVPADLKNKVAQTISQQPNVHVINEGHIYIWSLLCHNMIIAFSTSAITALLNKKHVFSVKLPHAIEKEENFIRNYWNAQLMYCYDNIEECAADIKSDLEGNYRPDEEAQKRCDNFIDGYYYKVDGNIFNRYVYFFTNVASESVKPKKEPIGVMLKYLLYDFRGLLGEKILRKQAVNNVVCNNDFENVHSVYKPKENNLNMKVVDDIYHYIEEVK